MQFRVIAKEPFMGDPDATRNVGPFVSRELAEQAALEVTRDSREWAWIGIEEADDPLDQKESDDGD